MTKTWNNTGDTRRRKAPSTYRSSDFARYIEERESAPRYTDFDFHNASVGGRYLRYGVESYGY